jgi:pimeloyl-ACP methyl ester carboxylesterase
MSKPVFVLLHGAWHTPRCWSRVVSELDQAGYESIAPALPSSGSTPPTPGFDQDVETIRRTVSGLVEMQRDVVVVMHSFAGMTGGTALDGLDKESRLSKNLSGGVVRLIYVAAFMVPERFQHSPQGTRENMIPQMKTDFEVRRLYTFAATLD